MEKTVYSGNFITVKELKTDSHTWEKAYFPDSMVVFPITEKKEVVMVLESRPHEKQKQRLKFITGHIDQNEDPLVCANREMQEEAGFKAAKLKQILVHKSSGTINSNFYYILAQGIEASKLPNPDGEDSIIDVQKVSLHELKKMISNGSFPLTLSCLGLIKVFEDFDI